jgi:hypothetical protein
MYFSKHAIVGNGITNLIKVPEAFRALIKQGAKIIIIPTFWTMLDLTPEGLARNPRSEEVRANCAWDLVKVKRAVAKFFIRSS